MKSNKQALCGGNAAIPFVLGHVIEGRPAIGVSQDQPALAMAVFNRSNQTDVSFMSNRDLFPQ